MNRNKTKQLILAALLVLSRVSVGSDLQADLERGSKLLRDIGNLDAEQKNVIYIELNSPNFNGCGSASLSSIKVDGENRLKYATTGTMKAYGKVSLTKAVGVLDMAFHLKEWSSESSIQNSTTGTKKYSVRVLDGKLQTKEDIDGKISENEYPLDSMDFVCLTAEIFHCFKPGHMESFALRELDPKGEMILPKFDIQTQKLGKSPGRKYEIVTWVYTLVKKDDGAFQVQGRRMDSDSLRIEYDFNAKEELISYTSVLIVKEAKLENRYISKIVSKERMEEVKASLEKP